MQQLPSEQTIVTVAINTWYNLRIIVNNVNSSIGFYINNSLVSTITTNIPSTSTYLRGVNIIVKSAGTTSTALDQDYIEMKKYFTINLK